MAPCIVYQTPGTSALRCQAGVRLRFLIWLRVHFSIQKAIWVRIYSSLYINGPFSLLRLNTFVYRESQCISYILYHHWLPIAYDQPWACTVSYVVRVYICRYCICVCVMPCPADNTLYLSWTEGPGELTQGHVIRPILGIGVNKWKVSVIIVEIPVASTSSSAGELHNPLANRDTLDHHIKNMLNINQSSSYSLVQTKVFWGFPSTRWHAVIQLKYY